jgi:hypothetical protein
MIDISSLKVYSPGYQAVEWGLDWSQCVDLATALQQKYKIAVLPVFCADSNEFSYLPQYQNLDLSKFDLVLFTDIEWRSQTELMSWIESTNAKHWLLHVAGLWLDEKLDPRTVYRPAWSFNFLRWNTKREDFPTNRPFKFDCLLGARRAHRDFVMLGLQQTELLNCSLTTYRDIFVGHWIQSTPQPVQSCWPSQLIQYPYVSYNLDAAWEVKSQMDNSVSGLVPWGIYNRTWFSVVCETLASGRIFLSAEKMAKCFHARRLFVVFGIQGFLQKYQDWGFETFADIIDESYDSEHDDLMRWQKAFDQITWLCKQDLSKLVVALKPRLDHNHHRLYELEQEKRSQMHELIAAHLK